MVAIAMATPAGLVDSADAGWAIPIGCPVYDVEGEWVGAVAAADAENLAVERGLFTRTVYVPLSAVAEYDGRALRLTVTQDAVRRGDRDSV